MTDRVRRMWATQERHPGDRKRLFATLDAGFEINAALYPGSYVDLAPAFVFDDITFVDSDRRAAQFFNDRDGVDTLIAENRTTSRPTHWRFLHADYTGDLPLADEQCDLLVSLYAGVVSQTCTRYLRPGGILLANASHGDVAMATLNPDYRLAAVVLSRAGGYEVRQDDLDTYLQPKRPSLITAEELRVHQRGIAYTRTPYAYVFQRIVRTDSLLPGS